MQASNLTPAQKAAQTRRNRQQQSSRLARFEEALAAERTLVNRAIADGAVVIVPSAFGDYVLGVVRHDHWYSCHPVGQRRDQYNVRSFCGANDGTWANICRDAGVARQGINAESRS